MPPTPLHHTREQKKEKKSSTPNWHSWIYTRINSYTPSQKKRKRKNEVSIQQDDNRPQVQAGENDIDGDCIQEDCMLKQSFQFLEAYD